MDPGLFDSMNPYQNLEELSAGTPSELLKKIKSIHKPVHILNIVSHDGKLTAFIMGDIKKRSRENG